MNYTEEQIERQFNLLPEEVQDNLFTPAIETKVHGVGNSTGLTEEQSKSLTTLVNFVILGLIQENDFPKIIEQELKISPEDTVKLTDGITREIFIPINEIKAEAIKIAEEHRQEEIDLFGAPLNTVLPSSSYEAREINVFVPQKEQEHIEQTLPQADTEEAPVSTFSQIINPTPVRTWEKTPEVIPDNLPTQEKEIEESFLPNLAPKTIESDTETKTKGDEHPFEEKMKKVFTAGQQSMGDLNIESPRGEQPTTTPPPTYHVDPYREPIE